MFGRTLPLLKARVASSLRPTTIFTSQKYFSKQTIEASSNAAIEDMKATVASTDTDDFDDIFGDFNAGEEEFSDVDGLAGTDSETAIGQVFGEDFPVDSLVVHIAKGRLREIFGEKYMDDNFEDFLNKDSDSEAEERDDYIQNNLLENAMHNSNRTPAVFRDRYASAEDLITLSRDDKYSSILDPRQPPRLTYQHVKMIKNIDYSPVLARAQEGDQFTAGEIMSMMLMAPDNFSSYLAKTVRYQLLHSAWSFFLPRNIIDLSRVFIYFQPCFCLSPPRFFSFS